jgi:hypothetical protein
MKDQNVPCDLQTECNASKAKAVVVIYQCPFIKMAMEPLHVLRIFM